MTDFACFLLSADFFKKKVLSRIDLAKNSLDPDQAKSFVEPGQPQNDKSRHWRGEKATAVQYLMCKLLTFLSAMQVLDLKCVNKLSKTFKTLQ